MEAVVSLVGVVYNSGKMFCLCCCEYGNLSSASCPFATGGCTNLTIDTLRSHDISTGHDNVVKARCAQKHPAVQLLLYLNFRYLFELLQHLASTTCILSGENLNALDNGPVHQKVNFEPWVKGNSFLTLLLPTGSPFDK